MLERVDDQPSFLESPGQVPSRLKHILPFSYRFGLILPKFPVQEKKCAKGGEVGNMEPNWKSMTSGASSYGVLVGPTIRTRNKSSRDSHVRTKMPSGREDSRILCS